MHLELILHKNFASDGVTTYIYAIHNRERCFLCNLCAQPYTEPIHYRGGEAKSIRSDFQWTAISHLPPICSWLAEKWSNLNLLGHAEMGAKVLSMCCTQTEPRFIFISTGPWAVAAPRSPAVSLALHAGCWADAAGGENNFLVVWVGRL